VWGEFSGISGFIMIISSARVRVCADYGLEGLNDGLGLPQAKSYKMTNREKAAKKSLELEQKRQQNERLAKSNARLAKKVSEF